MNIIQFFKTFDTEQQAVEYLENVRWPGKAICPYCDGDKTCIHNEADRKVRRWQCWTCEKSFSVTVGTVFHRTHVPLRDWFLILALMINAKKSISSCQVARDLGIRQPTVWSIMQRIRTAMAFDPEQKELFKGIIEADETYIGGKPRKANRVEDRKPAKRGKGTSKTPIVGALERGGRVTAQVVDGNMTQNKFEQFITRFVEKDGSILITDQDPHYRHMGTKMAHAVINHSLAYVEQLTHTNEIEGFWSLLKRAWYGTHHHYSLKYMPLYLAEACWKWNHRDRNDGFEKSLGMMVGK